VPGPALPHKWSGRLSDSDGDGLVLGLGEGLVLGLGDGLVLGLGDDAGST
jgi:hypothetical protein